MNDEATENQDPTPLDFGKLGVGIVAAVDASIQYGFEARVVVTRTTRT